MQDGMFDTPLEGEPGQHHAPQPPLPAATLSVAVQPAINVALWQNSVPVLNALSITINDEGAAGDLNVGITCEPPVILPRSWRLQRVRAGEARALTDLDVQLDGKLLAGLTEAIRATATISVRPIRAGAEEEQPLAEEVVDLRVLARDEWGGSGGIPDILAAFVEPNDPEVAKLLRKASDYLRAAGKTDSLEGYQATGKPRLWEQLEALWRAVASYDIRYVNPPPSFEQEGQRIRPPRQIGAERLATCLDLAVLFAAATEHIGMRPVIVLTRDHAFAGAWLTRNDFGSSVADDAPGLRTRLALDDIVLFECTLVCGRSKSGFRRACDVARAHLDQGNDGNFRAVVDIQRARHRRIRPLSSTAEARFKPGDGDEAQGSAPELPPEEPPPLRDDLDIDRDGAAPSGPVDRLEIWRKRLLDLTGRNRLLNMPSGSKQDLAIDCPDPVRLEAMLAEMRAGGGGKPLRFRSWPDLMDGADPRSARIHQDRMREDASRAYALEALERRELMVGRGETQVQAALTEIFRAARSNLQDGGSNTLFLAIGTLLWRQGDRDRRYRAPIILVPVLLERPSVRSGFSLRAHEDDVRINQTLLEMLRQQFNITFPALQADRPMSETGVDVATVLGAFRERMRDIQGWEVVDEVVLSNLSFAKYLMWKDLADRAHLLRENEIARRLMDGRPDAGEDGSGTGQPPAAPADGSGTRATSAAGGLDDEVADLVCPLEADSSQLRAVALARSGESFVMIGPPGAGKSQTITNIIADTLSRSRTVLFVAEKRTALEVVRRNLEAVGLADFCLDLFSPKSSKAHVVEQMARAQRASDDFDRADWQTAMAGLSELRSELNGYVRELHRRGRNGWTPFRAMGVVLRAEEAGVPRIPLPWPSADAHDAGHYQRLEEMVENAAAMLARVGDITAAAALAGVEHDDWSPRWEVRLLDTSRALSARLKALQHATVSARRALGLAPDSDPDGQDFSHQTVNALRDLAEALLDPKARHAAWALGPDITAMADAMAPHEERAARYTSLRGALAGAWLPAAMELPLVEIHARWTEAGGRRALSRTFALRAVRKRLRPVHDGKRMPKDLGPEIIRLLEMQALIRAVEEDDHRMTGVLGVRWAGMATDFATVRGHYAWAARVWAAAGACAPDLDVLLGLRQRIKGLVGEGIDLLAPQAAVGGALTALSAAWAETVKAAGDLAKECGSDPFLIADPARPDWIPAVAAHLDGWRGAAGHLRDWCAWRGMVQRADAEGVGGILRVMEEGLVPYAEAANVFRANYARWWIGLAVEGSHQLRGFVASSHEKQIERFRELDEKVLGMAARLVRATLAAAIPDAGTRSRDQEYAVLSREMAKKHAHLPVRALAERMPTAMRTLTPCLMMSPLSVAQYLPANSRPFDLVIFDEASQIPVWDAIGAIGRGSQVIVVGDPKQLPPTRFFERQMPDGSAEGGMDAEPLESILDECLGAGIPQLWLRWHYRSRFESLIAFSNHMYYGGDLVTFPSPRTTDDAVSYRHVPDGIYARAGARTNQVEARALVQHLVGLLRSSLAGDPERSIGVVTFNAEQAALIENLLDAERREDPRLEPFFSEERREPVLVRNLESVQGEERDVMLFSLTYGPDQTGRVAMNFGPLNQDGGERRLNVAVTRARERLIVFGSLRPEHIVLSRTEAAGVIHLRKFLEYAKDGPIAFARAFTAPLGDFESPFEAAVAARLSTRGWTLHPQIGVSGFRIDLGVVDKDEPGSYLAGVECDGATYHAGATARDRDRLRQLVLERLGWRILRIWSTDWWTNAERECDRLHAALEAAQVAVRAARQKAEEERTRAEAEPGAYVDAEASDPDNVDDSELELPFGDHHDGGEAEASAAPGEPGESGAGGNDEAVPSEAPQADSGRFYEDGYRETLGAIIAFELRHGPVRMDRLAQRVARMHGFQRTGREINDRMTLAIPRRCKRSREAVGVFVWPVDADPAAGWPFRAPVDGGQIDPAEVPIEVLVALAHDCIATNVSDDAILFAMRDACRLGRMSEAARARFQEALDRALTLPEL